MEAEAGHGLIWSLTIVVMPIVLGLAIAYGAYETWRRRKTGTPVRREPGHIDNVHPPDDKGQNLYMGKLALISTVVFVIAAVIIVVWMF